MKRITVGDYQRFCQIPSGSTVMEYNVQIGRLIGLDVNTMTSSEVSTKVKEWLSRIVSSKKEHKKVRLGTKWYVVDRDLYTLTFAQWIFHDHNMKGVDETTVKEVMHHIIANFLRECRVGKWFPRRYETDRVEEIAKTVQKEMDITVALEMVGFFFDYILRSMRNTQIAYSERSEKALWDRTNDSTTSTGHTDGT